MALIATYNIDIGGLRNMTDFNPKKTEKIIISLRIPVDTLKDIDRISADIDLSRNEFVLQCIDYAIENYHNVNK